MEQDRISLVRQRAHAIWIEQGQPEGAADQHWAQAEAEFDAAEASATTTPATESADTAVAEPEAPAEPAPLAEPDVVATPEPVAATPAPAPAKKTVKRKVKPLNPIR
ncbi:hypothetical protein AWL63_13000 [Sphingomonas panacis]|uniref:DUF2934 domain-containing protein n=1 Tax=Sphingomonas panacis TaxID=1560345 RepID=A0A1B3ZBF5_9SPHN|nr:DUF2934 domain-containing protein [Sphingomonas panacis]AOH84748.1 hypothetical protein AWL63_13000 [Sphingomonas panacis]